MDENNDREDYYPPQVVALKKGEVWTFTIIVTDGYEAGKADTIAQLRTMGYGPKAAIGLCEDAVDLAKAVAMDPLAQLLDSASSIPPNTSDKRTNESE